jgi:hypothetical protein
MNPGYLSVLLYVVFLILYRFGWISPIQGRYVRASMKWFLLGWPVLLWVSLPWEHITWNGAFAFMFLWTCWSIVWVDEQDRLSAFTLGVLLGSVYFLMRELMMRDPVLIIGNMYWNIFLSFTFVVLFAFDRLSSRMFAAAFGLMIGEILWGFQLSGRIPYVEVGALWFHDVWWMTMYGVSLGHAASVLLRPWRSLLFAWRRRGVNND